MAQKFKEYIYAPKQLVKAWQAKETKNIMINGSVHIIGAKSWFVKFPNKSCKIIPNDIFQESCISVDSLKVIEITKTEKPKPPPNRIVKEFSIPPKRIRKK